MALGRIAELAEQMEASAQRTSAIAVALHQRARRSIGRDEVAQHGASLCRCEGVFAQLSAACPRPLIASAHVVGGTIDWERSGVHRIGEERERRWSERGAGRKCVT